MKKLLITLAIFLPFTTAHAQDEVARELANLRACINQGGDTVINMEEYTQIIGSCVADSEYSTGGVFQYGQQQTSNPQMTTASTLEKLLSGMNNKLNRIQSDQAALRSWQERQNANLQANIERVDQRINQLPGPTVQQVYLPAPAPAPAPYVAPYVAPKSTKPDGWEPSGGGRRDRY